MFQDFHSIFLESLKEISSFIRLPDNLSIQASFPSLRKEIKTRLLIPA